MTAEAAEDGENEKPTNWIEPDETVYYYKGSSTRNAYHASQDCPCFRSAQNETVEECTLRIARLRNRVPCGTCVLLRGNWRPSSPSVVDG